MSKILMLFIDMLGGQYLQTCNENAKKTEMDKLFQEMGGTVYKKCYSPAPDTPRSSACMWTGLYPKKNLCDLRLRWPEGSLNRNVENIWTVLQKKKYTVNVFICKSTREMGMIPFTGKENIYEESIYQFMREVKVTEDSFNFIYLPDLHYILDETAYQEWGFEEGEIFQTKLIREILDYYDADNCFDYVLMCSDHGVQIHDVSHIICDERANTFMFLKKKGDVDLCVDEKLRSNLDVFPTVCDLLEYTYLDEVDGKSLLDKEGHPYIFIEDLNDFFVEISQAIEHWCVVMEDRSKHWLECDGKWEHEKSDIEFDEVKFEKLLNENMSDVQRNLTLNKTAIKYKDYVKFHRTRDCYSNGEPFFRTVFYFDDNLLPEGKKVILYGAGSVGKDIKRQLEKTGKVSIVEWIDLNYMKINQLENLGVNGLGGIFQKEFDYILICIQNREVCEQVKNMLLDLKIDENKIILSNPVIRREKNV